MPMPDMPGGSQDERELTAREWAIATVVGVVGAALGALFWWPLMRYVFAYYFA